MKKSYIALLTGLVAVSSFSISPHHASAMDRFETIYPISTNTGDIRIFGADNARVDVYVGNKRIGKGKLDKYGDGYISITRQKLGTVIKVYQLDTAGNKTASFSKRVVKSSKPVAKQITLKKFTDAERDAVRFKMKKWAVSYAKKKHLAVTDFYFTHGAAGWGDWFADTLDGEMQIQDNNLPGYYGFKMHALGGLVFYKPKDGKYGYSEDSYGQATFMNYKGLGPDSSIAYKWLFGDNGKLYEEKKQLKDLGFYTAMGEYSDKGVRSTYPVYGGKFKVSQDTAAQKKYKAILNQYR